jgi:hypothetical protein
MAQIWDMVVITWRDAYSPAHRRSKDLIKHKIEPCIRRSAGFLLRDDEDNVVICMEDDREAMDAIDTDDDCENVTVIPRGMVVKMDELTVRRPRAEKPESNE